ncbi:sensor histidine kinase [Chryseomicrobium sp. FSL W7-1435]|uniref:sensor histidine kinase n=1 Tax=Chryseomicrobium sp. FSL W7-1435 TaxID=2921704 RepID=UPI00315A1E3F
MNRLKRSLAARLVLTISAIILTICVLFLVMINHYLQDSIVEEMGDKALTSAYLIADRPDVLAAFSERDPTTVLQPIAEEIRQETGATFVVIGNAQGIRYTHPDPEKIGLSMVGGDNDSALVNREAIVSITTGSLGESIRGKVPVIVDDEVVGIISVGYLTQDIQTTIATAFQGWLLVSLLVALGGFGAAWLLALYVKNQLLGMQPTEIADLYSAYHTILEETTDGIVLASTSNDVIISNARARELIPALQQGGTLHAVLPEKLVNEKSIRALEIPLQQQAIIISKAPLKHDQGPGYLYFFRTKLEYEELTNELTRVKQQGHMQRAKTHEFSNKLHVLLGLLKRQNVAEAISFIRQEQQDSSTQQQMLGKQGPVLIQALLEGKISEAKERGIAVTVEAEEILGDYSDSQIDALVMALGNVLQNAIEALQKATQEDKRIQVVLQEYRHELIIEVQDNGPGIADETAAHIFTLGYSTKDGFDRGYGLALSEQALQKVGGTLLLEESDLGGACFLLTLERT